jgi:rhodanese-related sulfurtransferase
MRRFTVGVRWLLALCAWTLAACTTATPAPPPSPTPQVESVDPLLDQRFQAFLAGTEAYGALGLAEFRDWLEDDPAPFVLDVRTPEEAQATGHIAGAVLIPLRELANRTDLLPSFDTTIVTYCGSGWRCTMALPVLAALGWESVFTLKEGSLSGWMLQGYPVVPGAPPEPIPLKAAVPNPRLLEHMRSVLTALPENNGAISPEGLAEALADGEELLLMDIRSLDEASTAGFIRSESQLRIAIEELIPRRGELPEDKSTRVVTYCGTGHRCLLAMMMLRSYGYTDVRNLVGGLQAWQAEGLPVARIGSP